MEVKMVDAQTATAADFDHVAQTHANFAWFWGLVSVAIGYFFHWWAILPAAITIWAASRSVICTSFAMKLRNGTYPINNPNNGAPDGDCKNGPGKPQW